MFENKKVHCDLGAAGCYDVYYSRLIASWKNVGGERYPWLFDEWLKSLGLNEGAVTECFEMYTNGKLEAERSADQFLKKHKND